MPDTWLAADGLEAERCRRCGAVKYVAARCACRTVPSVPRPSTLVWQRMRPTVTCPNCHRRGRIQRIMGRRLYVEHHCPGPFVLTRTEDDANYVRADFRLTIWTGPGVGPYGNMRLGS